MKTTLKTALAPALLLAAAAAAPHATATPLLAAESDLGDDPLSYCRPYGNSTYLPKYAYCAAQGTVNAAVRLGNHVLDGNVTTLHEAREAMREFVAAAQACVRDPGNRTCPTEVFGLVA